MEEEKKKKKQKNKKKRKTTDTDNIKKNVITHTHTHTHTPTPTQKKTTRRVNIKGKRATTEVTLISRIKSTVTTLPILFLLQNLAVY